MMISKDQLKVFAILIKQVEINLIKSNNKLNNKLYNIIKNKFHKNTSINKKKLLNKIQIKINKLNY